MCAIFLCEMQILFSSDGKSGNWLSLSNHILVTSGRNNMLASINQYH
ncbi:MAG: hypothetical protein Hyperionvirus32_3 [Hyperionvirus sp.]|uniref:Uncharacterized protein n=1 Tax=Hyperionvirus sp. TaxID=2487770 RepID=A0A3G5ABP8_9VIRU|nr:MAG: hypothetical protein Hyperionvirus32_3 [Hyperionvirus sp.]